MRSILGSAALIIFTCEVSAGRGRSALLSGSCCSGEYKFGSVMTGRVGVQLRSPTHFRSVARSSHILTISQTAIAINQISSSRKTQVEFGENATAFVGA